MYYSFAEFKFSQTKFEIPKLQKSILGQLSSYKSSQDGNIGIQKLPI